MRRRLVTSTAAIALISVIVLGVPLGLVEAARVRSDATARLEREADAVASAIDDPRRGQRGRGPPRATPADPAGPARALRPRRAPRVDHDPRRTADSGGRTRG